MDRRTALKRMAASGIVISGAGAIMSSPAFADGGSVNSRPTGTGGTVTFTAQNINKNDKRVFANISGLNPGSCAGTSTPVRQYRWDDPFGGSTNWVVLGTPVGHDVLGPTSGWTETVTFSVRWLCPTPAGWAWSCWGFPVRVAASPGGGNTGSVTVTPLPASPGAALNCDIAPFPTLP